MPLTEYTYDQIRNRVGLESLQARRTKADIYVLYKIVNGFIDCPEILSLIDIRVPPRDTRNLALFATRFHRCNYGCNAPIARIVANGNKVDVDFFSLSFNTFRNRVKQLSL